MRIHPGIVIRQALQDQFPQAAPRILDREYATLNESAWRSLHENFVYTMRQRGLPEWLAEKGDCDDWAWLFRAWLIERNWRQEKAAVPVAIFYLHYTTRRGEYHAVNAAVVRRGAALAVLPIEPQPHGGPFAMTAAERQSCNLILG